MLDYVSVNYINDLPLSSNDRKEKIRTGGVLSDTFLVSNLGMFRDNGHVNAC